MTDELFLRGFRSFDAAVAPDAAFTERLYAQLAGELGFEPGEGAAPAPTASVAGRVRRAFRLDWRPLPPAQMRLVYLAAAVALLAAALAGSVFVASQLLWSHLSPLEIVRRSQAVVADPPAFALVYRTPDGTEVPFSTDGRGTWRIEDPDGSFTLWDGDRMGLYNASGRTWGVGDGVTSPPFVPLMSEWAWRTTNQPGAVGEVTPIECADAEWVGEETVAGRAAYHVRCPSWHGTEYWIDRDTGLVLRFVAGPDTPGWTDDPPPGAIRGLEVVSLDLAPNLAAFDWGGPVGAYDPDNPPPSTVLAVGAPVPTLTATTVDGDPLALPAPGRPTAVLFTGTQQASRAGRMNAAFGAAAAAHPGVRSAVVFSEMAGTVAGYRDMHPMSVPLVGDWDVATWQAWGITIPGTLVLVDAGGNAVRLGYEELDAAGIDALLGALETGTPLPEVTPVRLQPTPTFVPVSEEAVTEIAIGAPVPGWLGRLLDGGTFDSRALAGRPYVLANFARSECEACPVDGQLEPFGRAAASLGERARFVLVGSGESVPGATQRLMQRLGIDVPVVMDWDGAVGDALRWVVMGTIVVDADGRLAAVFQQFPGEAAIAEVLDHLEEAATPAP